jgi:hypothetical protein
MFAHVNIQVIIAHKSVSLSNKLTKQFVTQHLDGEHASTIQQSHLVYTTKPDYSLFPYTRGSKRT